MIVTHAMNLFNAVNLSAARISDRTVFLSVLPLFHTGGLNVYSNPVFHAGGAVIATSSRLRSVAAKSGCWAGNW